MLHPIKKEPIYGTKREKIHLIVMAFTPRSQVPVHYEILHAKDRTLIEKDYQPYLLSLQTQGVT